MSLLNKFLLQTYDFILYYTCAYVKLDYVLHFTKILGEQSWKKILYVNRDHTREKLGETIFDGINPSQVSSTVSYDFHDNVIKLFLTQGVLKKRTS